MAVRELETIPSPWPYFNQDYPFGNDAKDYGVIFNVSAEAEDSTILAVWAFMGQNASGCVRVWAAEGPITTERSGSDWGEPLRDGALEFGYKDGCRIPLQTPLKLVAGSSYSFYIHCDYKSWDPLTCGVIYTWPWQERKSEPRGAVDENLRVGLGGIVVTRSSIPFMDVAALDPKASLPVMLEYMLPGSLLPQYLTNERVITGETGMVRLGLGTIRGFGFVVEAKKDLELEAIRGLCVRDWTACRPRVWVYSTMASADWGRAPGPDDQKNWQEVSASPLASDPSWLVLSAPASIEAGSATGIIITTQSQSMVYEMYKTEAVAGEDEVMRVPAGGYSIDEEDPFTQEDRFFCPVWCFHGRLRYRFAGLVVQLSAAESEDGSLSVQATSLGGRELLRQAASPELSVASLRAQLAQIAGVEVSQLVLPSGVCLQDGPTGDAQLREELESQNSKS